VAPRLRMPQGHPRRGPARPGRYMVAKVDDREDRRLSGAKTTRVGLYSTGINLLLVTLKLGLAALSGSLALMADAIHSLVDVFGSLIVLAGLLIARRSSRLFPYGLYKVENLVSVVLALLIFLAAYEIATEALFEPPREITNAPVALIGVALAILVAYLFSRYERRVGEQTGSPSLIADSQHFRADVLSSVVVFIAVLGSMLGLPLDRIGAAVIVLFIVRAGWGLLVDGMRVLLDASLSYETLTQVREVIASDPGVAEIRSLVGRNSGRYRFVEIEVSLRTRDLRKAHQISERIEAAVKQNIPRVDRVLVHYEPVRKETLRWAVPLESLDGAVSSHFGEAPYFALVDVKTETGELAGREVLANPYVEVQKQKGIRVAEFLIGQGIDGLALRESLEGKGPSYVLAEAGVEVVATEMEGLSQVLASVQERGSAGSGAAGDVAPRWGGRS
jgi:cation diffusion facilitator family transporter